MQLYHSDMTLLPPYKRIGMIFRPVLAFEAGETFQVIDVFFRSHYHVTGSDRLFAIGTVRSCSEQPTKNTGNVTYQAVTYSIEPCL